MRKATAMKDNPRQLYLILFVIALAVNFIGIDTPFFTDDQGLYASLSKNLVYRKEFFELFTYNQDWLDKPHFPFWMVMLSFKVFGVSVWAYRLPALLFFLVGLRYTYLFGRKFYGSDIAWIATLIVATAQHLVMSNTDVRAEPYLLALITGSIYHISRLEERYNLPDFFMAALLTACAVMTKGVFVVIAIYGALLGQLIFQHKFKQFFRLKWLLLILVTIVFTIPEFYALYIQFDLHPEKTVVNKHHVSGIKWFLWDSQFGRFANTGPISRQSGDVFFYLHTLLWAFAPWCLVFYYAIYKNVSQIFRKEKLTEYYAFSGGMILLLLFTFSGFQLPFYTNIIFPLFAIITAPYCFKELSRAGSSYRMGGLWLYILLLPVAIIALHFFSKPGQDIWLIIDCVLLVGLVLIICNRVKKPYLRAFCLAVAASLFANLYLNTTFYDLIAGYRGTIKAADYVNQKAFDGYHLYSLRQENNVFQFYAKRPVDFFPLDSFSSFKPLQPSAMYVNHRSMEFLRESKANFKIIKAFENYPNETLQPAFINRATRDKVLDSVYLITK